MIYFPSTSYRLHLCTSQLDFLWLETVLGVIFDEKIQWNQMLDIDDVDDSFYFSSTHALCFTVVWRCVRSLLPLSWHCPTPFPHSPPRPVCSPLSFSHILPKLCSSWRESVSVTQNWFVLAATPPLWDTDVNSLYVFPNLSINPNQPKWSHAV